MSITLVSAWSVFGNTANYGISASIASPAVNVPAGALITTGCSVASGIVPSVSDTAGNTYTVLPLFSGAAAGVNDSYVAYCLSAIANAANVITWSASGTNVVANNGAVYKTSSGTWSYDKYVNGEASVGYGTNLDLSINTAASGLIACHAFEYYVGTFQGWTFTGVTAESTNPGSNTSNGAPGNAYGDAQTASAQTGFAVSVTDGSASLAGGKVTAFLVSYTVAGGGGATAAGKASVTPIAKSTATAKNTASGKASVAPTAQSSTTSKNTASASPSVALIAAGTAIALLLTQGATTVTPTAQGAATSTNAAVVAASVAPNAAASAISTLAASGYAAVGPSALGTATASNTANASASVAPTAQGTAQNAGIVYANGAAAASVTANGSSVSTLSASGAASVGPGVSGAVVSSLNASGEALVTPRAAGSSLATLNATGAASVIAAAQATAQNAGLVYANGTAAVALTANGGAFSTLSVAGLASITPSAHSSITAILATYGAASVQPVAFAITTEFQTAQGNASVAPVSSGTTSGTLSVIAAAFVTPSAQGATANVNALITVPKFYLQMPARNFSLQMSPRNFYLQMPSRIFLLQMQPRNFYLQMLARSFYIKDSDTMPAQNFPVPMDPLEIQVLTIDKTPDLVAGETLTGLSGSLQVTTLQGTDTAPNTRFGVPQINTAAITAQPPMIPTTINAGMAIQIECTDPQDGCWYLCRQACTTSTGRTVTLKGILQVTSR
jgi:hypothetical protein